MSRASRSGRTRAALVIGHPGHELRVWHWVERARPRVFVLTDGSGRAGEPRLATTTRLLESVGAETGTVRAPFSDADIYAAMLAGGYQRFVALAETLAAEIGALDAEVVVSDAAEGCNPTHDVCRLLASAAVALVRRRFGHRPRTYDFLLYGPLTGEAARSGAGGVRLALDAAAFRRKLAAGRAYAELQDEVRLAVEREGLDAFRAEHLRPADPRLGCEARRDPPLYELYGEHLAAGGVYREVLRYQAHVRPLGEALRRHVETAS